MDVFENHRKSVRAITQCMKLLEREGIEYKVKLKPIQLECKPNGFIGFDYGIIIHGSDWLLGDFCLSIRSCIDGGEYSNLLEILDSQNGEHWTDLTPEQTVDWVKARLAECH